MPASSGCVRGDHRRLQPAALRRSVPCEDALLGRLIAQGGLATGLLHALVAMELPGAGSVFVRQSWKFPKPVYIGDVITAVGTVKSAQPKRRTTEMEFRVTNQDGDLVLEGDALVYQADASG